MEFVPNAQNDNEPNDNQAAPPNLQTLLQKIRRFRLPSDENIDIKNIKDSINLVDANPVKFPIFTKHHHYQLLNLCELSTDGEAIYFSSNSLALPESLIKEAELNGHKKVTSKEELATISRRDYGPLRKLFIKTGNICAVERISLRSIFSISCAAGFVAVNSSSEVQIMHEASQTLVRGQFFSKKHINTVQLVPFKINQDEQGVMLFVCKNGGEVTSYIIEEEDNKFVTRVHQQIVPPLNVNYTSFGSFEFGKYLICAADDAHGPIIYQMNHNGMFELLQGTLSYAKKTSSTMCSWQAQGPYLAMATERGQCIVWHFPSKEIIKELGSRSITAKVSTEEDDESDTSFTFSSEACVRLVKFNPVPLFNYILVFAEAKKNVHVVDTRTWEEQIIKVCDGDINGLCFSHDGKRLHVAHAEGIHVYDLILKKSLFESCVQYIHSNLHLKSQFNWQFDQLPHEVQRKIEY